MQEKGFFSITDTLSKALQKKTMCATEAKMLAAVILSSLKEHRSDVCFEEVWEELVSKVDEFHCEEPVLPAKEQYQSELMRPAVVLILMLHLKICIADTI